MRFTGKVFLVTGGGRGIGRAIARRLVHDGGRVCIVDRDRHAGSDAAREYGEQVCFVHANVAREAEVRRAVTRCVRWGRRLDGVVNNAAIAAPNSGPIDALTLAGWQRYLDNNLTSVFLVVKHAVRHLRVTRGAIVNLGSICALQTKRDYEAYAASKGAIVALSHAMAISLGPAIRSTASAGLDRDRRAVATRSAPRAEADTRPSRAASGRPGRPPR